MRLVRCFLCAVMAAGTAVSAEEQTLPPPVTSAINRLVSAGTEQQLPKDKSLSEVPGIRMLRISPTSKGIGSESCSVPLTQPKMAEKPKFLMRELPLPKESPDAMPVLKAPVCAVADAH